MTTSFEAIQEQLRAHATTRHSGPKGLVTDLLERGKTIYGSDSRVDVADSSAPSEITKAVGVLFDTSKLAPAPGGYRLKTRSFGPAFALCPGQPFSQQPLLGYGTGFLVAPNLIATAGHCVAGRDVTEVAILFSFVVTPDGVADHRRADEVYFGAEVLACELTADADDYALVRLDREVEGVVPLTLCRQEPAPGEQVYVVGHPIGLPKKFAGNATVTDTSPESHFVANLDAFGGNSGSPVFDEHHRVRGILVRGNPDFLYDGDCRVMATFALHAAGEHVCRTSRWQPLLQRPQFEEISGPDPSSTSKATEPPGDAYRALQDYLLSAYQPNWLRRLVWPGFDEALSRSVNFNQAPIAVVDDFIERMRQTNTLDEAFFDQLRKDRPRRKAEINAIQIMFTPPISSPIEPRPQPTSARTMRHRVRQELLSLAPEEFTNLVEFEIDEVARQHLRGVERVVSQVVMLINYYDVPHRGLDVLQSRIASVTNRSGH